MRGLRRGLILLLSIAISCGCGSDDSRPIGDWGGQFVNADGTKIPGANLTLDKEHHWREVYRNLVVEGTWRSSGSKVTLLTELFNHALVADAKKLMIANAGKTSRPDAAKSMAENLDKPIDLVLATDGKSMRRNDGLAGGTVIYTKQ